MRAIRTFAFAAVICTLAACSSSPTLSAPSGRVSRDNGGLMGTGNNAPVPAAPSSSTAPLDAPGTMGSGNVNSSTTTVTTCTSDNGGLIGTGNNTSAGACDNGGLLGTGN